MHALTAKTAIAALGLLGATALTAGTASAMPNGLPAQAQQSGAGVDQVRWVCGPRRCWWQPNFYRSYGYYGGGPRFYGPRYGRWHRWHRW